MTEEISKVKFSFQLFNIVIPAPFKMTTNKKEKMGLPRTGLLILRMTVTDDRHSKSALEPSGPLGCGFFSVWLPEGLTNLYIWGSKKCQKKMLSILVMHLATPS